MHRLKGERASTTKNSIYQYLKNLEQISFFADIMIIVN